MKVALLVLVASAAIIASAVPIDDREPNFTYPRYIDFADEDGVNHVIDLEAEPDREYVDNMLRNPANNKYLLFTRRNQLQAQQLFHNNFYSVQTSNYDPRQNTVVIVHGWLNNQNSDFNTVLKNVFLAKDDINVIVLDWSWLSRKDYISAVYGVPEVGRHLGQFVKFLISSTGGSLDNVHLVGFSLGSHVVGNAGRECEGRIARITALDPAGPLWNFNSNRLSSDAAQFVEAIHTDGGYTVGGLGIGKAIAQVDFFPNGGISQPGCLTNICNHNRSWEFFAATVTYNHLIGKQCSNDIQLTLNTCRGQELPMGNDDFKKRGSGKFRVDTGRRYPF